MPVVIVADAPWKFGDKLPGKARGAERNYECLDTQGIVDVMRPVCAAAGPDAVLFKWRVAAMQAEALAVISALGFTVKSELVWLKQTKTGKSHFGMGRYVRASHEVCLIATRGKALPAIHTQRSVFEAPVGVHSEKPSAFYRIVEEMYPGSPLIEMFARRTRPGWTAYGNQVGLLDAPRTDAQDAYELDVRTLWGEE